MRCYALGQRATMTGAVSGDFVWKEFRGASARAKRRLALMFISFVVGFACSVRAPVVGGDGRGMAAGRLAAKAIFLAPGRAAVLHRRAPR